MSNLFKAGNTEHVCQRILWVGLRAHDIMACYKRNNFKDDPTVFAELVKFMAINTSFEALEVLGIKVKAMEADIATAKKEGLAAAKAAGHLPPTSLMK
jgi:hypothetical protein